MPFFTGWFGADVGDDYFEDWFDADTMPPVAPERIVKRTGIGGSGRFLGNLAPRPQVPPWRQIPGATGSALTDVRRFLHDAHGRDNLWGNHVNVTITADQELPMRVATGLGGPHKGYHVVGMNNPITVYEQPPDTPVEERGFVWLNVAATTPTYPIKFTLYVY